VTSYFRGRALVFTCLHQYSSAKKRDFRHEPLPPSLPPSLDKTSLGASPGLDPCLSGLYYVWLIRPLIPPPLSLWQVPGKTRPQNINTHGTSLTDARVTGSPYLFPRLCVSHHSRFEPGFCPRPRPRLRPVFRGPGHAATCSCLALCCCFLFLPFWRGTYKWQGVGCLTDSRAYRAALSCGMTDKWGMLRVVFGLFNTHTFWIEGTSMNGHMIIHVRLFPPQSHQLLSPSLSTGLCGQNVMSALCLFTAFVRHEHVCRGTRYPELAPNNAIRTQPRDKTSC